MNELPAVQLAPDAVTVRSDDPDPWTAGAAYAQERQRANPPAVPPVVYAVVDGVPVPLGTPAPTPRRFVPAKRYAGRFGCPVPRTGSGARSPGTRNARAAAGGNSRRAAARR